MQSYTEGSNMIPVIYSIADLREKVKNHKKFNQSIGFVPTMGYLHEGHLSLVEASKKENDITIISIFVNPTQFGKNEDFSLYPRDLKRDLSLLNESVDYVFTPSTDVMYPPNSYTEVSVNHFSSGLCGDSRPGHFTGVATIVTKLLNIVTPNRMYLGLKDMQQYLVIKQMVKDLNMDVSIIGCPTIREHDGLAMSSRNVYLDTKQREQANILYKSLVLAKELVARGESDSKKIIHYVTKLIQSMPLATIDYVEIRDTNSWNTLSSLDKAEEAILALAVFFGKTRLIDNMIILKKNKKT